MHLWSLLAAVVRYMNCCERCSREKPRASESREGVESCRIRSTSASEFFRAILRAELNYLHCCLLYSDTALVTQ
jgi:hypothetical protein